MAAFTIKPAAATFGATIEGLDVRDLDDESEATVLQVMDAYRVLVFRDQRLTPDDQKRFSERFGPLVQVPYVKPLVDHPEVIAVLKEADEINVSTFGSWWHSDFSYLEEPPTYSILHALELPPVGGDTLFADMIGACDALSPSLRDTLAGLKVMHSGHIYGAKLADTGDQGRMRSVEVATGDPDADVERAHPMLRYHEPTGRRALFANPTYTTRFAGMTPDESKGLLDYLYAHATQPRFTWRQVWQPGDLVMWDNRAVLHLAVNDYDGYRRLLHRTTAGSEIPVGAPDQQGMA
ncbi:MAG: TauD/TfdA family dioxygenase [Pseudomonadota bacterium]